MVDCDECGKSLIGDPRSVSLFVLGNTYTGISRCPQCDEPIVVDMIKDDAIRISRKGVKVFSWETGEVQIIE